MPAVRVLAIEDQPVHTALVRAQLDIAVPGGFEVLEAGTVADGVSVLARHGAECVLLDLGLPDADGLSALEAIRSAAVDVPVVVLTVRDDEQLARQAVGDGAQDCLVKGQVDGRLLARALTYAIERKRAELQLAHLALHDRLTGLPNRTLLLDRLGHAIGRLGRNGKALAVLFCDLDGFAVVNDSLGHEAGDALLVQVAERLGRLLRGGDTAARFGGDEFVLLCEDVHDADEAMTIAERIAGALAAPFRIGESGQDVFVRTSVGIAMAYDDRERPEALVRDADAAMCRAKVRGGGVPDLFDGELRRQVVRRMETESDLHRALERGELTLHYQPLLRLDGGGLYGVEALVRWHHPTRGLVPPSEFIPVAESSGLISQIGAWVFERACRQWVDWGRPDCRVSVNLSARQAADPGLPEVFAEILERTAAAPQALCLEVTETTVMGDVALTSRVLGSLKALGLGLAIDDFGTGYSSLRALQAFPFDEVKIDRSFVAGMEHDHGEAAIVAAVVSLARALGLSSVAEGVETVCQRDRLHALGCDVAQGFLFAHPAPPGALASWF